VQLEIKLESWLAAKNPRGDEWLYFWIRGKRKIESRTQVAVTVGPKRIRTPLYVLFVIVPPASYSSGFCLKKKTNILIPIEFLMEQFRIVPHSTSKGRKKRNQENCVLIEANEQSLPLSTPFPAAIKMHPSSASSFFLNVSRIELQQKKQKTKETETHTKQLYRT